MFLRPSDINPQLTDERLDIVGRMIADAHAEVLQVADDRDTAWSIGCRSHVWRSTAIVQAVEAKNFNWLKIEKPGLHFVFSIGGIPVSMYRGSHERPKKNILKRAESYPELQQFSLFLDESQLPELVWSFALETGPEGEVLAVEFVGMTRTGETFAHHSVPLEKPVRRRYKDTSEQQELIDLPPAKVSLIKTQPERKRANSK